MISTRKLDQSIAPLRGRSRRTGARIGSVSEISWVDTAFRPWGSTHDIRTRPSTSSHTAMRMNWTNARRAATATSLPAMSPTPARRSSWAVACAEQCPSDPDDRRALFDRHLEVVGHPHRELRTEGGTAGAKGLRHVTQPLECWPGGLGLLDEPPDRHEPPD